MDLHLRSQVDELSPMNADLRVALETASHRQRDRYGALAACRP